MTLFVLLALYTIMTLFVLFMVLVLSMHTFFWCYLSSQLTELIDISHIEEMQIPRGTRTLPGRTLGSLWATEVSGLVARCGIGPSTVQNSLGRKWDTKLRESGTSEEFVR